jgi:hypothetical protein
VLDRAEQVDERASEPVDGPRHHDIEISPTSIAQHPIETRALRTTFGAADPGVRVDLHDVPAPALRDPSQFPYLVLYRLGVGADPHIDRRPFDLPGHARLLDKNFILINPDTKLRDWKSMFLGHFLQRRPQGVGAHLAEIGRGRGRTPGVQTRARKEEEMSVPDLDREDIDLLDAASVERRRTDWRPIETAPKDGTEILVFGTRANIPHRMFVAHFTEGGGEEQPHYGPAWFYWNGHRFDEAPSLTHWMPLPVPPVV